MEQKLTPAGTTVYLETVDPKAPTVILIHNMWGSHKSMHRHSDYFKARGFNTASFNLVRGSRNEDTSPFRGLHRLKFTYLLWVEQITDVLNFVSGPKHIFSFSGPSLSGLIAAHDRSDILAYICDGGPFEDVWACTLRMFERETEIPTTPLRMAAVTLGIAQWGPFATQHLHRCLSQWSSIPLLSIRGLRDPIVYPECIDKIFRPHSSLPLSILEIPEGVHLDGMKNFKEMYQEAIDKFLRSLSSVKT